MGAEYVNSVLTRVLFLSLSAGSYGMKVLLDMHQDALNRRYCGTGVPDWVTEGSPAKADFPEPLGACNAGVE